MRYGTVYQYFLKRIPLPILYRKKQRKKILIPYRISQNTIPIDCSGMRYDRYAIFVYTLNSWFSFLSQSNIIFLISTSFNHIIGTHSVWPEELGKLR